MIELYLGDALQEMDNLIARGIKVDAVLADPPYNKTMNVWDSVIPFEPMWTRLN